MRYGLSLLEVEKPGRYEGLEVGSVVKDWGAARLRVALCFPDVYEIGASHLGLPLLYGLLNREPGVLAERAYAPWHDMEALLRRRSWLLVTRESGRPLADFDLVGFTLQYELGATNVLAMLELGGVPLLARERGEDAPLVLGGGPVAANPEPLADFFDAYLIGEGEEAVVEIAQALVVAKHEGRDRAGRLAALAEVEGVYLTSAHEPRFQGGRFAGFRAPRPVRRRVVADLETAPTAPPILPFVSAVHERLSVELARGCTRGCRFCQAGTLYRPVRERSPEAVRSIVAQGLEATGYEEVGLLSLSTGDYSSIGPLLCSLMNDHAAGHVSVSLPSLRADSLDDRLLAEVSRVRKTGFTIAPEAGTERLRRVINKNLSEEAILGAVRRIFEAGWRGVKLYFMVGLPGETPDDWAGIAELARKVARLAPAGKGRVGVSVSNFVPKPHTPFQWCGQARQEVVREAQEFFKAELRDKKIELKWHDSRMSELEGVLARGDRRLGAAVLAAYRKGCRMDGWTSELRWDRWQEALAEAELDPAEFLRPRDLDEPLPWDDVDPGVSRAFLVDEWRRAESGGTTADCRGGECQGCGLCDFQALMPRISGPRDLPVCEAPEMPALPDPSHAPRIRFRFSKTGPASLLSHLETVTAFHRAFRAGGVPLAYSQGFHPHPRLNLGPALPLGTETLADLGEIRVTDVPPLAQVQAESNAHLPEGLRVEALWLLPPESKGLTGGNTREEYRLSPSPEAGVAAEGKGGWRALLDAFWAAKAYPVVKRRKNKTDRVLEATDFVDALWSASPDIVVRLRRQVDGTILGPEDLLHALVGLPDGVRATARVVKTRVETL
ncbi:MAG: TIGR03960 family B12-binding radical SAM protein [Deltaproteobacteria bacterium]|nr:TIGR03960 family B12-binding radical SAM protein [Deltaproteobacteria bacterium]